MEIYTIKYLENKKAQKHIDDSLDVICPFCKEKDFDLIGLKAIFYVVIAKYLIK